MIQFLFLPVVQKVPVPQALYAITGSVITSNFFPHTAWHGTSWPEIEPMPLHWKHGVLTTEPTREAPFSLFYVVFTLIFLEITGHLERYFGFKVLQIFLRHSRPSLGVHGCHIKDFDLIEWIKSKLILLFLEVYTEIL